MHAGDLSDTAGQRLLAAALFVVALLLGLPGSAAAAVDDTILVSKLAGVQGNAFSNWPTVSADGRYVAFDSESTNIDDDHVAGEEDVFRHDTLTGQTIHVTPTVNGFRHQAPSISDSGCRISFTTNFGYDGTFDQNSLNDIYVVDVCAATSPVLVSRNTGASGSTPGQVPLQGAGPVSSISGDGNHVAFVHPSPVTTNPATADQNPGTPAAAANDVFIRDLVNNTTKLVSQRNDMAATGNNGAIITTPRAVSSDGSEVSFYAEATNDLLLGEVNPAPPSTDPIDSNGARDVFVRDFDGGGSTERVSLSAAGGQLSTGVDSNTHHAISGDGNAVTFHTSSPELENGGGGYSQVYVRNRAPAPWAPSSTTTLVSRASGPTGAPGNDGGSDDGSLSFDGRFAAFSTFATNLVFGDIPNSSVLVRDNLNQVTFMASRQSGVLGAEPVGNISRIPQMARDGGAVVFSSGAPNLVLGDTNNDFDIFHRTLAEPSLVADGATFNVRPTAGTIFASFPGDEKSTIKKLKAKGKKGKKKKRRKKIIGEDVFFLIEHSIQLPIGSSIDARTGRADITTTNSELRTQTASFYDGMFKVTQAAGGGGLATMELDQDLPQCENTGAKKKGKGKSAATSASGSRSLWGSGKGKFRTRGFKGSATVRGTTWLTQDTCTRTTQQTFFQVTEGTIEIDDFTKPAGIDALLNPGQTYKTATPKPKKKKKKKKK